MDQRGFSVDPTPNTPFVLPTARLQAYRWPGNVRELRNLIERLMILSPRQEIGTDDLPSEFRREDGALAERAGLGQDAGVGLLDEVFGQGARAAERQRDVEQIAFVA